MQKAPKKMKANDLILCFSFRFSFCFPKKKIKMDHESYFKDVLKFFHDSQWIFNTPVTEILVKNSLDKFPHGWLDVLQNLNNDELNNFVAEKKYEVKKIFFFRFIIVYELKFLILDQLAEFAYKIRRKM